MNVQELAKSQEKYVVECRRWLHRHAELAWKEYETTEFIVEELRKIGIEPQLYEGHTGCSALIKGGKAGENAKTILLRADIDAMPGTDVKDVPYKSENEGAVHSCGHDSHTAMLLAAAKILYDMKEELPGNVKLVFEAAEEIGTGAGYYVEQGIMEDVDGVFAVHLWSELDKGYVGLGTGPRFSNFTIFHIDVHGFGDATMNPHLAGDAILAASKVVENLQLLETHANNPLESTVIAVGTMHGGFAPNTYCDHVKMTGTIRTFSNAFRAKSDELFEKVVQNTVEMLRCSADVKLIHGTPAIIQDDEKMNTVVETATKKIFGEDAPYILEPTLGSDTFGYFVQDVPGVFAQLGCRDEEHNKYFLHNDAFDFDESIMVKGVGLFVQVVKEFFAYDK